MIFETLHPVTLDTFETMQEVAECKEDRVLVINEGECSLEGYGTALATEKYARLMSKILECDQDPKESQRVYEAYRRSANGFLDNGGVLARIMCRAPDHMCGKILVASFFDQVATVQADRMPFIEELSDEMAHYRALRLREDRYNLRRLRRLADSATITI